VARTRWRVVLSRLILIYVIVELAVAATLASTIGLGWTLMVLLAALLLGWGLFAPIAGVQLIRQIGQLRSGLTEPRSALSDGAMVSLATALVLLPGLVTSVLGLLLLVPPVRSAAAPALAAIAMRGVGRRVRLIADTSAAVFGRESQPNGTHRDYIDGEVLNVTDVTDVDASALPGDAVREDPPEPGRT